MIVELLSRAVEGGLEKLGFENMPITHSQRNKHQLHLQQIRDAPKGEKKLMFRFIYKCLTTPTLHGAIKS